MKNNIKLIIGVIIGFVLSSSVVYAVALYQAREVAYDNTNSGSSSTDVQSAIDELYEMAEEQKSGRKYLFKDGKFAFSPTTLNISNKDTYQEDGYLEKSGAESGTILELPYVSSDEMIYIEFEGINNAIWGNDANRYGIGVRTSTSGDYWNSNGTIKTSSDPQYGNISFQKPWVFAVPGGQTIQVYSGIPNNLTQFKINSIWVEKANHDVYDVVMPSGNAVASDVKEGVTFWNTATEKEEVGTYKVQQRYIKKLGSVTTTTKNNAVLTFNVKNVDSNYSKYTTSDFVDTVSTYYLKYGDCIFRVNSSTWNYDNSTGILTISLSSSHNYIETVSYTVPIYVLAYN